MISLDSLSKGRLMDHLKKPSKKVCKSCKKEKELKDFVKVKSMKDGRLNTCIECENERKKAQREQKKEHSTEYFDFDGADYYK